MENKLYLLRASRYVEADPFRGRPDSTTEYSQYYLTVDKNEDLATNKFLTYLRNNGRPRNWKKSEVRELSAGSDISLEKRVEILKECFPFVE